MYSHGTIMNPLGIKKVQMCPFEGTAPVLLHIFFWEEIVAMGLSRTHNETIV